MPVAASRSRDRYGARTIARAAVAAAAATYYPPRIIVVKSELSISVSAIRSSLRFRYIIVAMSHCVSVLSIIIIVVIIIMRSIMRSSACYPVIGDVLWKSHRNILLARCYPH